MLHVCGPGASQWRGPVRGGKRFANAAYSTRQKIFMKLYFI